MAFVQQKNSVLADRRFARHEVALRRAKKEVGPSLWRHFVGVAGLGAVFAGEAIKKAMRAFENRYRKHYGLTGVTYKPNGERECARRRRQIAKGQLTHANGVVFGVTISAYRRFKAKA